MEIQLELELWNALESAILFPETADLRSLCQALDHEMLDQSLSQQLEIAGRVLADLCEIYAQRSARMIEGWENRFNPVEPTLPDWANCAELFVQSSVVDFGALIEPGGNDYPHERSSATPPEPEDSVAGVVDKDALLGMVDELQPLSESEIMAQVQQLAHGENIDKWIASVGQVLDPWFASGHAEMPLLEIAKQTGMPLVEVWLGLLLGSNHEYRLYSVGDFYAKTSILVGKIIP